MRNVSYLIVAVLAVGSAGMFTQGTSRAGSGNPISQAVRQGWGSAKKDITQSAEIMPEANYDFKPVDTVRTFGQILAHVAGANYVFCSASKGEKAPHAEDDFEKTLKTKAEIVKALNDSLAYCDGQYTALDDKSAAEMVTMPFGMPKAARASPLMMNTGHLTEHYGNLVAYFRIKGIVPPSSRQQ
jgi:uncharacterized damage-inducible protein DinB